MVRLTQFKRFALLENLSSEHIEPSAIGQCAFIAFSASTHLTTSLAGKALLALHGTIRIVVHFVAVGQASVTIVVGVVVIQDVVCGFGGRWANKGRPVGEPGSWETSRATKAEDARLGQHGLSSRETPPVVTCASSRPSETGKLYRRSGRRRES